MPYGEQNMIESPDKDALEQANTPEQTDWLQLARDAFSSSSTYFDANIRNRIIEDIRQASNIHPQGSKYLSPLYKNRSRLFRPKTRASIRKSEAVAAAAYFSSEDVVSVRPFDDNDKFQEVSADVNKALLQYRLTKPAPHGIPWFLILIGAYQEAMTVGVVCSKQEWQYDEKKGLDRPMVELLAVENVRIDPAAKWYDPINTSPYVINMIPMYIKDVKAKMKNRQDGQKPWNKLDDGQIRSAVKHNWDTIRGAREQRTDSTQSAPKVNDFTIVWVHENFVEVDGVDYVYYTLGDQFMLSDPVPVSEVYWHGVRPIVMGFCVIEAHKNYPSSKPTLLRDLQREANEIVNQRLDNVKLVMDKRWLAKRNRLTDLRSLKNNTPNSVTLVQDLEDVKMIDTPDVTSSAYQEQERINADFDDTAGSFSSGTVQTNRQMNETVGGLNLISSSANQVEEYQLRVFTETWVEPVLRQLLMLESYYESNEIIIALAGKDAQIWEKGHEEVTQEMLDQDVILNVNVGIGSINPQTQLDRFLYATNSLAKVLGESFTTKLELMEIIKEVYGKCGYKDGARFINQEDQPDPMAVLQEEILKAKLLLTQAQTDQAKEQAAKMQAEKVTKLIEALYESLQAAQIAATIPGVVPIADAISSSAGFVDQNAPPLIPEPAAPAIAAGPESSSPPAIPASPPAREPVSGGSSGNIMPENITARPIGQMNTSPQHPPTAGSGALRGIETQRGEDNLRM